MRRGTKNVMTENDKLQKIEIDTVRAVTELKSDIKNLTTTVEGLKEAITNNNKQYATKVEVATAVEAHKRDINDLSEKLDSVTKGQKVKTILWSLFSVVLTFLVMYVVEDVFNKRG